MSKVTQFPNGRQIEVEACAWIAQLDGNTPSQEDLTAFREWIGRSPRHAQEIKRLSALWSDLNIMTELADPVRENRPVSNRLLLRGAVVALAVVLSIAVTALYFRLQTPVTALNVLYSTGVGEQKPVTLADGSK